MKDLVQSLCAVSDLWLDSKNPLREETIQALQVSTGLNRRQIELALANCFKELTPPKITAYVAPFEQVESSSTVLLSTCSKGATQCVLHVLPSNAFTAWVHGVVTTLLLGRRCLLKPSMREPVFSRAWKKSLADVDPELGRFVEIVSWEEKWLHESQLVVAYGSDETLRAIESRLPPGVRFAGYGHKLSVGIIFREAWEGRQSGDLLERVIRDADPFRLQGCLSPQILYVEEPGAPRWPELMSSVDVAPKIRSFSRCEDLRPDLARFVPYLSCVGYAGAPEQGTFLENELCDLPVSRVCPLGEMQRPPLAWRNGGIFLPDLLN